MTLSRSGLLGALCFVSGFVIFASAQDKPPHPAANNKHLGNKGFDPRRDGRVSRRLRRLPRPRRRRLSRSRSGDVRRQRRHRRAAVRHHPQRAFPAPTCRPRATTCRTTTSCRSSPTSSNLGTVRADGNADWQRRQRPAPLQPAVCTSCHRVSGSGGRLGPDLSRNRLATIARRTHPRDPHALGVDGAGLRNGHAGDQGRPANPRRQEDRGRIQHPDHGYARAPSRAT